MVTTNRWEDRRENSGLTQTDVSEITTKPRGTAHEPHVNPEEEMILLQKCLAGDMAAWDKLIRTYEKSVFRFAYMLCKNRDDAADISGQVFVRVYQNLHTFRHESSFSSWLFRIVRNTYLDMCVRPMWRTNVSLDAETCNDGNTSIPKVREIADPYPSPETICIKKEVAGILASAVRHLPGYQREVVQMYHTYGKSYEQIAEATGLSIGTVKSRLNRARAMLRERLTPYMDTLTSA